MSQSADPLSLLEILQEAWRKAAAGNPEEQTEWQTGTDGRYEQTDTSGRWQWQEEGVTARSSGKEWSSLSWRKMSAATLSALPPFAIELTICGEGEAAGISFGDYKDFLADLGPGSRRLRLEIIAATDYWAFSIDGQLAPRQWWNKAVQGTADLVNGVFSLKGRHLKQVSFQDVTILPLPANTCRLSVILTCYRFLQRLRVTLRNWCHQTLPAENYELLVVNPGNLDGTHEHLCAVKRSYPQIRLHEIEFAAEKAKNKGAMINQAFSQSRGEWIWLTDADCLFSPSSAAQTLTQINGQTRNIYFGERRHLSDEQTDGLLSGRLDGLQDFESLSRLPSTQGADKAPWGYSQIIHRSILAKIPYPEKYEHFAHSDGHFVAACKQHRIMPKEVEGLFCLHLNHPFAWFGSDFFL